MVYAIVVHRKVTAGALAPDQPFEPFFGDLGASTYHGAVRARDGRLAVPDGPGLGLDPDQEVIDAFRLGDPVTIGA